MKRFLILLFAVTTVLSSCIKGSGDTTTQGPTLTAAQQAAVDDAAIQAYLTKNSITATKDASGLYYTIVKAGNPQLKPTAASSVTVSYTGQLLSTGAQFDANNNFKATLGNLIQGWVIGLPQIGEGGSIILYVPSALGYGTNIVGSLPANSVLIFNITLNGVNI